MTDSKSGGIASNAAGALYVAEAYNERIRKVTFRGEASALAGGRQGFANGKESIVSLPFPHWTESG
ncbi:MAG: hypothetical protein LBQ75_07975 [Zoogloeaceae bacterium]|nr:hypothetical protein [Zoogloeaceae bacterium]